MFFSSPYMFSMLLSLIFFLHSGFLRLGGWIRNEPITDDNGRPMRGPSRMSRHIAVHV